MIRSKGKQTSLSFSFLLLVTFVSCHTAPPDQSAFKEPMLKAAFKGDTKVIQGLLDKDADVNLPIRDSGSTVLMIVAANGNVDAVKLLLKRGASVNQADSFNCTALVWAVRSSEYSTAQLLLEHGADVHVKKLEGDFAARVFSGNTPIVRLLLKNGIDANIKVSDEAGTVLVEASRLGQTGVVEALLENGADPNARSTQGITPLMAAREKNYDAIVRLLKNAGAVE